MIRFPLFLVLALSPLALGGCASSGDAGSSAAASVPVYEVTAGSLNMRSEPSTSGAVVDSLKQGTQVQAPRAVENGWLYVETDAGTSGYVSARYVRAIAAAAPAPQRTAKREQEPTAPEPKKEAAPAKEPAGRPAPAGSKLSRVELGMSEGKVASIMGQPTSQENYQTGKAWIPYYYGSDTSRLDYKYKGVGVVVFGRNRYSGKTRVIQVDYDPTEDGY